MNSNSKARLQEVHPVLAQKITQLCEMLAQEGLEVEVTEGFRAWGVQDSLYRKGREHQPDGGWRIVDPHHIVTNAPPGHSWHQFGLAADLALDDPTKPGFQIDWNVDHPQWKRIEQVAVSLGMVSGADWLRIKDAPHVQLTGRFPVSPDDEVRQLFTDGGTKAVWDEAQIVA